MPRSHGLVRPTTNLYNLGASKFAESVIYTQLVSIALRRGIATQLSKTALARRNLEAPSNAPSDHPFTDAPSSAAIVLCQNEAYWS